jgi:methyltransferase (TIGR00027 family)
MKEGEASMTARRVARQRLGFARVGASYGRPGDDDKLQSDVAAGLDESPSGLTRYLESRTGFFDMAVVEAIAAGVAQVVVAGAGFDGRSLRYCAPTVRWFELDHPATQGDKLGRLARLGISTSGISFGAADFGASDVGELLASLGHDSDRPTLYFCEGVAPYLPRAVLSSLLAALSSTASAGSTLAIELALVPTSPEQVARRSRLAARVAALGEPLFPALGREELGTFLGTAGWSIASATAPGGARLADSDSAVAFVRAQPGR